MQTVNGKQVDHLVPKVLVVPGMARSILSAKQMRERDFTFLFSLAEDAMITPQGEHVALNLEGSLPQLPINNLFTPNDSVNVACDSSVYRDRNMHIAHGMQKQLVDAGDSGPVTGIRVTGEVEAEFCDWCAGGKLHDVPHKRKKERREGQRGVPPSLHTIRKMQAPKQRSHRLREPV